MQGISKNPKSRCLMQGISKNLVEKAFPVAERPDYLTGPDFYKFTPAEEFMSLPGDIARTEFRLVVTHEGWEYCILERDLGAHLDSQRNMLVTVRITAKHAFHRRVMTKICVLRWESCLSPWGLQQNMLVTVRVTANNMPVIARLMPWCVSLSLTGDRKSVWRLQLFVHCNEISGPVPAGTCVP